MDGTARPTRSRPASRWWWTRPGWRGRWRPVWAGRRWRGSGSCGSRLLLWLGVAASGRWLESVMRARAWHVTHARAWRAWAAVMLAAETGIGVDSGLVDLD